VVVMDMEAGIEHLGRATAKAVDKLIVVVEPGRRSIDTAENIQHLAAEIGLKRIAVVGNKIRGDADIAYLRKNLPQFDFLGFLPYDNILIEADLNGISPFDTQALAKTQMDAIIGRLLT
jgi:CO dehydrogenase maturation factor